MEARPTLLIIDDQDTIRSALATLLSRAGFSVHTASDSAEGLHLAQHVAPDLVLLDVVLDEQNLSAPNGLDVLRELRTLPRFIPVIMLTSHAEWQLESLGQGAIAFITKPWEANALISQIRATLRAVEQIRAEALRSQAAPTSQTERLHIADIEIDLTRLRVFRAGQEIDLTPLELALLTFLARHPNREWTRETLLDQVWGYEWAGYPRTVDRHVAALRRKLHLERDELIETVHGAGYRLVL
jgi:DNA-binding response OmpR family regulator